MTTGDCIHLQTHEYDPHLRGPGRPDLSVVETGGPEGALFNSSIEIEPDYSKLVRIAQQVDDASTLVVKVCEATGLLPDPNEVSQNRQALLELEESIEPLAEKDEEDPDTLTEQELGALALQSQRAEELEKYLREYNRIVVKIRRAGDVYLDEYAGETDRIVELHEKTQDHEDTIIGVIKRLLDKLPKPRENAGIGIKYTRQLTTDAERIARILVLDEIS